jgi:hypothetical protein
MVCNSQTLWWTRPHDRRGCAVRAVLRDGQPKGLGKIAEWKTSSGRFLKLHIGTFGKWAKPSDCARTKWDGADARLARNGSIFLGTNALHHGAKDPAHN